MILGFIGTGKISSSIILGIFKSKLKFKKIYISSRNRNIAKKLANKFGKVKIIKDNQEIINKSSIIFFVFVSPLRAFCNPVMIYSKHPDLKPKIILQYKYQLVFY